MAQANADQTMYAVNIMNIPERMGVHKLTASCESTSDQRFGIALPIWRREKPSRPDTAQL